MSIKLMSKVFDGSFKFDGGPSEPTMKLVLLALADHASDSGEAVYPSIAHVCAKTGLSRHAVKDALATARKAGILTAIGRRKQVIEYRMRIETESAGPKWDLDPEGTRTPGDPVPGPLGTRTRAPGDHVIINEPPMNRHGADAHAQAPSGRSERDPLDTLARFEAMKAQARAAGRDNAPAAHRMAGRWPHLVAHCRAFEDASGLRAADVPASKLPLWAKDLEGHAGAGLTPDDERTLVNLARSRKFDIYRPGSLDNLIAVMRKGAAGAERPRYKTLAN